MTLFSKSILLIAALSIVMAGCGGPTATAADPGPQFSPNPAPTSKKGEVGKTGAVADDKAVPAPAGVKTGTPSGGK